MGWETPNPAGDRLGLPSPARDPAPLFVLCAEVDRCGGAGIRDGPAAGLPCPGDRNRAEPFSGEYISGTGMRDGEDIPFGRRLGEPLLGDDALPGPPEYCGRMSLPVRGGVPGVELAEYLDRLSIISAGPGLGGMGNGSAKLASCSCHGVDPADGFRTLCSASLDWAECKDDVGPCKWSPRVGSETVRGETSDRSYTCGALAYCEGPPAMLSALRG